MLMVAILSWGRDLLIKPAESIQQIRDIKRRLDLDDVDYIIFDSGFFCPIAWDNFSHPADEELMTELFGNATDRHPAWE